MSHDEVMIKHKTTSFKSEYSKKTKCNQKDFLQDLTPKTP